MSHIVEFKIDGLVGRKGVYRKVLNRDVNVFYGLNGSGKTSLLKILYSALECNTAVLENVPFNWAEVTIYSQKYKRTFVRRFDNSKVNRATNNFQNSETKDEFIASQDINKLNNINKRWVYKRKYSIKMYSSWKNIYLPTWRLYGIDETQLLRSRSKNFEDGALNWDKYFASRLENIWAKYSAKIFSEVKNIQEKGISDILREIFITGKLQGSSKKNKLEIVYKHVANFLNRQNSFKIKSFPEFNKIYNSDPKLSNILNEINSVEAKIEECMTPRVKLEQLIRQMFTGDKTIVFRDTEIKVNVSGNKDIELNALSSGEKQALYIFIHTLLAEESTLIIDEPEMSLHIDWQKQLIADMKLLNSNAQFIIATHSPEIMSTLEDKYIFPL